MTSMAQLRVMVYIDGSNFYHSLRGNGLPMDIDFGRLAQSLAEPRRLVRAYYYNAPRDQTKEAEGYREQQRFFEAIRATPYVELRLGRLVYRRWPEESPYEKGVDIKLATDMLTHAHRNAFDVCVLVSGDTDQADAVQAVKDLGKHVEVALFGPRGSKLLRDLADRVVPVTADLLARCRVQPRPPIAP